MSAAVIDHSASCYVCRTEKETHLCEQLSASRRGRRKNHSLASDHLQRWQIERLWPSWTSRPRLALRSIRYR